ncbi:MAG: hypothetical protein HY305_07235, partial [Sphingobacteriales bacterium]|nr:hypothetical protein [Sphingobacteriales bacterium]
MNNGVAQIFHTNSVKRWRSFKWTFRVLVIIALFFIVVLIVALMRGVSPSPVNIDNKARAYENKLDPSNPLTLSNSQNKKYRGFKSFLEKKIKDDSIKEVLLGKPVKQIPFIR